MLIEENLLLLLTVAVIIGAPLYMYFREKMIKKPVSLRTHSRRRVIKLTMINIALNLTASLFFSIFLILILQRSNLLSDPALLILVIIYLVIMWLTFYGNGIYITSIVLEDFTLTELRVVNSFKTQFIATHLFHGPISHILIYSGWLFVLLILSIIEIHLKLPAPSTYWPIMLISGVVMGVFYAFAQIYNGTAVYQLFSGTVAMFIIAITLILNRINLAFVPVATYFAGLIASFELILIGYLSYLMILKAKGKKVVLDRSGGPGTVDPW